MTTTRVRHLLGWSLAACLAASGGIALGAGPTTPPSNPQSSQQATSPSQRIRTAHKVSTTATIEAIDRRDRSLTLRTQDGNTVNVDVPQSVTRFDALKKGDQIHIDYYESIAVSLNKGGAAAQPGQRESTTVERNGGTLPGGIAARKITTTAQVLNVDRANNTVTVKGPHGNVETIDVTKPEEEQQLSNLNAGDQIQVSYIQAVALDVQPGPGAQQPGGPTPGAQQPGAQQPEQGTQQPGAQQPGT